MKLEEMLDYPAFVVNYENFPGGEGKFDRTMIELNKIGLTDIRRITAIDGQTQGDYITKRLEELNCPISNFLVMGMAALSLTVLDILKNFLNSSEKYMWSFEDDIIVHSEFHEEFKKIKNLNFNDFDLLYLGGAPHKADDDINDFDKKWMMIDTPFWQTHALFWNRRAAEVYVSMTDKMRTIDNFLSYIIPSTLKKQNKKILKQACLLHSYETSKNKEKMKVLSGGKFECRGLIYQLKENTNVTYSVKI